MDSKNISLKKQEEDLLACNLCMYKFCMHWCPVYDLTKCVACNKCVEICEHDVLKLIKEWDLPQIIEKNEVY